jgi:hypothetical protein
LGSGGKRGWAPKAVTVIVAQSVISTALFIADVLAGPGIADGIGYSIVLVLCLRNPKRSYLLSWAILTSVLVVAGGIIVPDPTFLHVGIINRGLEMATIWVVWLFIRTIVPDAR